MLTRDAAAIVLQLGTAARFAADHLTAAIERNGTATQDRLLQFRTAALDAGFHPGSGKAEASGCFCLVEARDVCEQQCFRIRFRQVADNRRQTRGDFGGVARMAGRSTVLLDFGGILSQRPRLRSPATMVIRDRVGRNAEHPSGRIISNGEPVSMAGEQQQDVAYDVVHGTRFDAAPHISVQAHLEIPPMGRAEGRLSAHAQQLSFLSE